MCSNWKWPEIEGLHDFEGILCHTANYPVGTVLDNKRVAVIGVGSSGIQVTANIASKVKELYTWVRSPTWITAGFAQKYAGPNGENFQCLYTSGVTRCYPELMAYRHGQTKKWLCRELSRLRGIHQSYRRRT